MPDLPVETLHSFGAGLTVLVPTSTVPRYMKTAKSFLRLACCSKPVFYALHAISLYILNYIFSENEENVTYVQ